MNQLAPALKLLEAQGWHVDFGELTAATVIDTPQKRVRCNVSNTFMPRRESVMFGCTLLTRYPINARGERFLQELVGPLEDQDIKIRWCNPRTVDLEWVIPFPHLGITAQKEPECLVDGIKYTWCSLGGFFYSIAQILSICKRADERSSTKQRRKVTPALLASLCMCSLKERNYWFDA